MSDEEPPEVALSDDERQLLEQVAQQMGLPLEAAVSELVREALASRLGLPAGDRRTATLIKFMGRG